jgi:ferredoxin
MEPRKMGLHEWSYSNRFDPIARRKMMHVSLEKRFQELGTEVEMGFDAEQTAQEVERCLNCDIQTVFTESLCIECDACLDICPVQCLTITSIGTHEDMVKRLKAPVLEPDQPLFVSGELKQTARVMVKDENFCIHCGLCAERCPTAAWDMQKSLLSFPQAAGYGGDSASSEPPCQQRKAG